jgi:predicted GH43/DUF377 family glycosyl hydrolase
VTGARPDRPSILSWTRPEPVLQHAGPGSHLDRVRAFRPSVLQEPDGTLRMWYSGHDGVTGRILEAVRAPGQPWRRLGLSIDAGWSGASDAYGVEAPSVVRIPAGFLMAYAGSDGADTRLHMATSADGHRWDCQGTFMQRGGPDAVGATHPCLVVTGERWWLFYAGYDGSRDGRRAEILAAVSPNGASWDRVGSVLAPDGDELALSEPSVLVRQRAFTMVFVCDDGARASIDMATSRDGVSWDRRGTTLRLTPGDRRSSRIRSPTVARLRDGCLRMWYSTHMAGDEADSCRLWSIDFDRTTRRNDVGGAA